MCYILLRPVFLQKDIGFFFFRGDFLNWCVYVKKEEPISYLHKVEAAFCLILELLLLSIIIL